jgi:hypothetical protein
MTRSLIAIWVSTAYLSGVTAPAELGAEDAVVVVPARMQQADACPAALDDDRHVAGERQVELAVAGQAHHFRVHVAQAQLDAAAAGDHQRPVAEGVRADRHEQQRVQARMDQGAAAGQRIGGGAGGSRDDQAVGALGVDEAAVDVGLELDHPHRVPFVDDHIVQRAGHVRTAVEAGVEQGPGIGVVMALQDLVEAVLDVVRRDVDEKTQPAEVDADQGQIEIGHFPGRVQQGAVAADDDDQVAAPPEAVEVHAGAGVARQARRVLLEVRCQAARLQVCDQQRQGGGHLRVVVLLGDDACGVEPSHGGPEDRSGGRAAAVGER